MGKFSKIEKFIESMDVEKVNESAQALMLAGDEFGAGTNMNACVNPGDCTGASNGSGCQNTGTC